MRPAAVSISPRFGADGLALVVVQDEADGRVLMAAYVDDEAVTATIATGLMHFHSRSRGRLWRKGESSGNVLHVVSLDLDCDGDAILATVRPHGPTCHRGTRSCFDQEVALAGDATPQGFAWLETLWQTLDDRRRDLPEGSYTTSLLAGGVDAAARKVVEEATEVLMAAKDDATAEAALGNRKATAGAIAEEMADLLYHALVLLAERGVPPAAVIEVLRSRSDGGAR
ncbi:MAG: bifunctional phosphoribosyl-AMP cyclohydrolase/phosphoribosyl-ATP diphosphatase HisIE [Candidatus Limnocylindrales bacterium]